MRTSLFILPGAFCRQNETEWKGLSHESHEGQRVSPSHSSYPRQVPPCLLHTNNLPSIVLKLQVSELSLSFVTRVHKNAETAVKLQLLLLPPHLSFNLQLPPLAFLFQSFLSLQLQNVFQLLYLFFLFDRHLPVLYLCLQTDTCVHTHTA